MPESNISINNINLNVEDVHRGIATLEVKFDVAAEAGHHFNVSHELMRDIENVLKERYSLNIKRI